jgi:hypothetical protein
MAGMANIDTGSIMQSRPEKSEPHHDTKIQTPEGRTRHVFHTLAIVKCLALYVPLVLS